MTKEELYAHFSILIQTMPDLTEYRGDKAKNDRWLAKAFALVQELGDIIDIVDFRTSYNKFSIGNTLYTRQAAEAVSAIVLRSHAWLELKIAPALQGGFVPVGNALDAYKVLTNIFTSAKNKVLIVDPYMDDKILTEFILAVPENVEIQLLSDEATYKPEFRVAAQKWVVQYGATRPLSAKLSVKGILHDRLILVDDNSAWAVSQSFKDLAKRSPASIVQSDGETASLKIVAYNRMWNEASSI